MSEPSATQYHMSPTKGAQPCNRTTGECPYASTGHFDTEQEASDKYGELMEKKHNPLGGVSSKRFKLEPPPVPRPIVASVNRIDFGLTPELAKLNFQLESKDYYELIEFSNKSKANHTALGQLVTSRKAHFEKSTAVVENMNPTGQGNPALAVSTKTYKSLNRRWSDYSRQTDYLNLAYKSSEFFNNDSKVQESVS